MSTQKAFSVTLTKPGVRDYGVWAGKTGGESTRDVTDYYPGAQRPAIKYTDTPTTSDIVIRKREADLTDAAVRELYADLDSDAEYICVVQRMTAGNGTRGRRAPTVASSSASRPRTWTPARRTWPRCRSRSRCSACRRSPHSA
jgi:hypothetical protein